MKNYAAFLSFGEEDRELAKCLHDFLEEEVGLPTFYGSDDLARGSEDWIRVIREAVRSSECFVPILTRNSWCRPWVVYERGLADMAGLPFCQARTAAITLAQLKNNPGPDRFTYDLHSERGFADLVVRIYEHGLPKKGNGKADHEKLIRNLVASSDRAKSIIRRASVRSIFIAGSVPKGKPPLGSPRIESIPDLRGEEVLERVTADIVTMLLEAGFFLCSCPDVSAVGQTVARQVDEWTTQNKVDWREKFKIGGLLGINEPVHQDPSGSTLKSMLRQAFRESRRDYLRDQEWLLVLGGNERSHLEWEVAKEIGTVKVCAIPIFGGTAYEIWHHQRIEERGPITPSEIVWNPTVCRRLIDFLLGWPNGSKLQA